MTPQETQRRADCFDELVDQLKALVNCKALDGVGALVTGWNGTNGENYEKHPAQLGASIKTTCGGIYELESIMQSAQAALAKAKAAS